MLLKPRAVALDLGQRVEVEDLVEHGRISSTRSKAVIRAVNELCAELRPRARALVDAFGITDAALAAPIAMGTLEPAGEGHAPAPAAAPPA